LKNDIGGDVKLEVDESQLTGVSETILKNSFDEKNEDSDCFLRSGSFVYEGSGKMLVCCVGNNTSLGKIRG
jgi:magnesium-transporting ATPase (P-type)